MSTSARAKDGVSARAAGTLAGDTVYVAAVDAITRRLGAGSYAEWDEAGRRAFLLRGLREQPSLPDDLLPEDEEVRDVLETLRTIAGLPADLNVIYAIAAKYGLAVVEDAAHAFPAAYQDWTIGQDLNSNVSRHLQYGSQDSATSTFPPSNLSASPPSKKSHIPHFTCFSFYATKTITTGEGGMICTDDDVLAERCRIMALHGISRDVLAAPRGDPCLGIIARLRLPIRLRLVTFISRNK